MFANPPFECHRDTAQCQLDTEIFILLAALPLVPRHESQPKHRIKQTRWLLTNTQLRTPYLGGYSLIWTSKGRGLPRGFGDRRHCSKMRRQSFSDSPTADRNWKKKGDNLRQRQSIFTPDKATGFRFAFFRQRRRYHAA